MVSIHAKHKAFLHLSKGNGSGRERPNTRNGPGTSAKRIKCLATKEEYQREQYPYEKTRGTIRLFHFSP